MNNFTKYVKESKRFYKICKTLKSIINAINFFIHDKTYF